MGLCTQIDTGARADTLAFRAIHHHAQIRLPSDLLILTLMLFASMSPNSCSGACANAHPQSSPRTNPAEYKINPDAHTVIISFIPIFFNSTLSLCPQLQRSRRNPERSSKALLMHVSNCLQQKAIASKARMDRSGSGTCQAPPI